MSVAADERTTLDQFANVILRNVSLTTRLLRTVNSIYFNRRENPILSVSHAIVILGWDTIRDIAASMMLIENFGKQSGAVKELLLLSVLTGNSAREIASRCKYPRIEDAYLCGMFSAFGELLAATYVPEEYNRILGLMKTDGETQYEASLRVLGFSFDRLGKAMMRRWNLPDKLTLGMGPLGSTSRQPRTEDQLLSLIATFSLHLTNEVYRVDSGEESARRLQDLLSVYGSAISVKEEDVKNILGESSSQTKEAFATSHIPFDNIRLAQKIDRSSSRDTSLNKRDEVVKQTERREKDTLRRLSGEVESVIHSGEVFEVNDMVAMIMEAMYRGVGFDRVLFCLTDQKRTELHARLGVGEGAEELRQKFRFPISFLGGPVGPAILKHRDVFVEDMKESRYIRSEFAAVVGARSFMMIPVVVNGLAIGSFYADRLSEALILDGEERNLLLTLRDYLSADLTARKR